MKLPSFNAEQSLYRSRAHYRASALAGAVSGIRPSDNLPPGSYRQSCSDCNYAYRFDISSFVLTCWCLDENGDAWLSQFNYPYQLCTDWGNDLANCEGNLTCGPCSPYA